MTSLLADLKATARREMHATMGVAATYEDDTLLDPVAVTVRLHTRRTTQPGMVSPNMAEMISGAERLVFNREDLETAGVELVREGRVTIPEYDDVVFILDSKDPPDGPINESWVVGRVE
jgi:hypothetical protein